MEEQLPSAWPPPWHAVLAAVFFIGSTNGVAQREWEIAGSSLLVAGLVAMSRHLVHSRTSPGHVRDAA